MALQHARECRPCGIRLANERMLSAGLDALRDRYMETAPPETLEHSTMAAFHLKQCDGQRNHFSRARSRFLWSAIGAVAAGLAIFGVIEAQRASEPSVARSSGGAELLGPELTAINAVLGNRWPGEGDNDSPFIPLAYGEPLQPFERTEVQSVTLTRGTLMAMGIPFAQERARADAAPDPDEPLDVEVVVGENGVPRAVRVLNAM